MTFDPASAPTGVTVRLVPFHLERPIITPRSMLTHTMSARGRSTVQSAWNHATAKPGTNTLPHYALGLDAADGCAKFLETNRRGIANATVTRTTVVNDRLVWPTLTNEQRASIDAHGNIRNWSLAIETADTGTDTDPTISAFTDYQLEMVTRIYVHELGGWRIAPVPLASWWAAGAGTHTAPWEFPYTTIHRGKFCPGAKKKAQFFIEILPEVARRLGLAPPSPIPTPTPPTPPPLPPLEEADTMWLIIKTRNPDGTQGPHLASSGVRAGALHIPSQITTDQVFDAGNGRALAIGYGVIEQGQMSVVPHVLSETEALRYLGPRI